MTAPRPGERLSPGGIILRDPDPVRVQTWCRHAFPFGQCYVCWTSPGQALPMSKSGEIKTLGALRCSYEKVGHRVASMPNAKRTA